MNHIRRKPFKFKIGDISNSSTLRRMFVVAIVFLLAFIFSVIVRIITTSGTLTLDVCKRVMSEMLSPISLAQYISGGPASPGKGWVLLIEYVLGLVFFTGFLIASLTALLQGFFGKFKAGELNYSSLKNHILFLGYNDMVIGVLNTLWQKGEFGKTNIVIGLSGDVASFRENIFSHFASSYRDDIILVHANISEENDLMRKLQVHRAREVYIIGEERLEEHDSANLNMFVNVCRIAQKKGNMPQCHVNFKHQSVSALFQTFSSTKPDANRIAGNQDVELFEKYKHCFHPFNFDETWARKVALNLDGRYDGFEIDTRPVDVKGTDTKCDRNISEIPDGFVHIVICGLSEMGQAFAKEMALLAHYPNFLQNSDARTRITIVDEGMKEKMDRFVAQYSELFVHCRHKFIKFCEEVTEFETPIDSDKDFLDVEFEFIEARTSDPRLRKQISAWCEDDTQYLTFVFCYEQTERNNADSLFLPRIVYDSHIPIFIHQRNKGCLGDFLAGSRYAKVCPFGMCDDLLDICDSVEVEWAKRLNHFYRSEFKPDYQNRTLVEAQWRETVIAERWSSIHNVTSIPIKYRIVGYPFSVKHSVPRFTTEQLNTLMLVEHNRWCVEKLIMGYHAVPAEVREQINEELAKGSNKLKKQFKLEFAHNDIVPFNELGNDEKGIHLGEYDKVLCDEYANIVNSGLTTAETCGT